MSEDDPPAKRMRLGGDGLVELSKEDLIAEHKKQEAYIATLLSKVDGSACGSGSSSDLEERLKLQHAEASRKEKVLLMQLTRKEQELQEIATQLGELTKANTPGDTQLRSALLDPALNILFQRMRNQLDEKSKKLQQATDDMAAWKFTPDSQTGKRLMSKCRTLIQENQELGKQVSTGRTAQLEAELALQKKYSEELKASQDELNEFVIQLDEEVEGMQSTICALQQQLKEAKDELATVKAKQAQEPRTAEDSAPEQEVHAEAVQQDFRTSAVEPVEVPKPSALETDLVATEPRSPSRSPAQRTEAGNRTPSREVSFTTSATGEGSDSKDNQPWTADESMASPPAVPEGVPGVDDRTADGNTMSRNKEEEERTTGNQQEENERTTKKATEEVRTFDEEEMETQEQHQQEEQQEGKTALQATGQQDLKDSTHEERREQPEIFQQWYQEQPHQAQQDQHQDKAVEEMEIDSSRYENESSSTESEGYPLDIQQSKSSGELTSPVVSKTLTGEDSDEGISTMTPDQGSTEPATTYLGLDQTHDDSHNPNESSFETKSSVEPSGSSDPGVVDSASSGQGTEESSTETREVEDPSTNTEPPVTSTSQTDEVGNSTSQNQAALCKTLPETQISNRSNMMPMFTEVKVSAKKLPHNCSRSVVDYDTGSSDEDDCTANVDNGGLAAEEALPPPNKSSPQTTTNHSPLNQSPESPQEILSPDNNSPASPANDSGKTGSDISPLKNLPIQLPPGNGDSDTGLLAKSNEPKELGCIEENGTGSVHNSEQIATAAD